MFATFGFLAILTGIALSAGEPAQVQSAAVKVPSAPDLSHGAALFTFDDLNVAQWVAAAPVFRETGARATFFISWPDTMTSAQIEGLRQLRADGHSIGCHSLHHLKAVDSVTKDGIDAYLAKDILPANAALQKAGFVPTAFAYPSSQNNAQTDAGLLRLFRHLRTGTGLPEGTRLKDLDIIFVPVADVAKRGCLVGTGIDAAGSGNRRDYVAQVCEALDRAYARREIVVFYAHCIADTAPGHHIKPALLRQMLEHAKSIGLPCIGYDDLPAAPVEKQP